MDWQMKKRINMSAAFPLPESANRSRSCSIFAAVKAIRGRGQTAVRRAPPPRPGGGKANYTVDSFSMRGARERPPGPSTSSLTSLAAKSPPSPRASLIAYFWQAAVHRFTERGTTMDVFKDAWRRVAARGRAVEGESFLIAAAHLQSNAASLCSSC